MKRAIGKLVTDKRTETVYDGTGPSRQHGSGDEYDDPTGAHKHRQTREHVWIIAPYRLRAARYPLRVRVRTLGSFTRTMTRRYPPSFFEFFDM